MGVRIAYSLDRHASERAAPHATVDELTPASRGLPFCLKDSPDFLPFSHNEWVIDITICLDISKRLDSLLSTANLGQPSRRLWQERKPDEQEDSWDELDTPGCAE